MTKVNLKLFESKMKQKTPFIQPLLITASVMLFLGMFSGWPYGYYTLLRLVVFIVSGLIAVAAYKMQRHVWTISAGLIALLFNPFAPIHFNKATWRVIDFVLAVLFLVFAIKINKQNK